MLGRNAHKIVVQKPEGKRILRETWEYLGGQY
jgi:hypothetical protein